MAKRFDRQLDKATDSTLIDPNWDGIIECVDLIRGGEAPVKSAVASIRKRFHHENPHVAHHALLVLEACMKNCGTKFHAEVATKDFMEDLKILSLENTPDKVKNKILELLHCWAVAFKNKPEYKIVVDTHNLMKLAGFDFPEVAEADAMFIAESAPEWAEGGECFRCRTSFGFITRKHHCRACGQIFCDKCSSKQSNLPRYGIEKQVRVCDGCYEKAPSTKAKPASTSEVFSSLLSGSSGTSKVEKPLPVDAKKTAEQRARELKQAEEDEINLALAISQSEAEALEQERQRRLYQMCNGTDGFGNTSTNTNGNSKPSETAVYKGASAAKEQESSSNGSHVDPELARYLNRDYWQQRKAEQKNATENASATTNGCDRRKTPTPTAPPPSESSYTRVGQQGDVNETCGSLSVVSLASTHKQLDADRDATPIAQLPSQDDEQTAEMMEFCKQLKEQVTVMDNRIRSNIARNRSIVNDTAIQSLFIRLTEMHAQVMARMNKLEDQRNYFESLQDHLAHIQEARQAVTALREDHERRKQERALEEQRIRQMQMQQKVDLMRQKKHQSLLHQRHLALLRFQQQEQEMHMRRIHTQQGIPYPAGYYPAAGMPQAVTYPPSSIQNNVAQQPVDPSYYAPNMQYVQGQYGYPPGAYVDPSQQGQSAAASQIVPSLPPSHASPYFVQQPVQDANDQVSSQPPHALSNTSVNGNMPPAAVASDGSPSGGAFGNNAQQIAYGVVQQQQPVSVGSAQAVNPSHKIETPATQQVLGQQTVAHIPPQQVHPNQMQQAQYPMQQPPSQMQYSNYQVASQGTAPAGAPQALVGPHPGQPYPQQQTGVQVNQYYQEQQPTTATTAQTAPPQADDGLLISFD